MELPQTGQIAVFRPSGEQDLSALDAARVQIIHGFYPHHEAWRSRGYRVAVEASGSHDAGVVFLPRAKAQARDLIARAADCSQSGIVIVDGQKTDGVDSILKACRKAGARVSEVFSKAHGKTFSFTGGDFSGWRAPAQLDIEAGFVTAPGVFSADGIDTGSALLAAAMQGQLKGRVCDLGAGWGYLSRKVLSSEKVTECHLVEAEHAALECARHNIDDARAQFHWADATQFSGAGDFDHVVTNPPFHVGRAADASLGQGFIAAAARLLGRRGTLWLVANRHLPYERELAAAFGEVAELGGDGSFKVLRASRPHGAGGRGPQSTGRKQVLT